MVKRSPWTRVDIARKKHRRFVRSVRRKHAEIPFGARLRDAASIANNGVSYLSGEEKVDFLKRNKSAACSVMKKNGMTPKGFKSYDPEALELVFNVLARPSLPSQVLDALVLDTATAILSNERGAFIKHIDRTFQNYINERKIPLDKRAFDSAMQQIVDTMDLNKWMGGKVDFAAFERVYLRIRKLIRKEAIENANVRNFIIEHAFPGKKFTPNQAKAIRGWVNQNIASFGRKQAEVSKGGSGLVSMSVIDADEFISGEIARTRQQFSSYFKRPTLVKGQKIGSAKATPGTKKHGNRQERLANYVPIEKNAAAQVKASEEKIVVARTLAHQSNPLEHSLAKIRGEDSPAIAERFRQFSLRGLSEDSIAKLSIAGGLSRRSFMTAIDSFGFVQSFGESRIDSLARIISFIGPEGKQIDRVRRFAARSVADGPAIYDFLVRNRILNTRHVGGTVVYLYRAKY